jgi:hypothetical protein
LQDRRSARLVAPSPTMTIISNSSSGLTCENQIAIRSQSGHNQIAITSQS